jgi:xanthosine utilization system XapX-like protein
MYLAAFIAGLCNGIILFLLEVLNAPEPKPAYTSATWYEDGP